MIVASDQERVWREDGLRLENLSKVFAGGKRGPVIAVNDFSLEIAPGSFVTLLGPSGCGKTTTLRLIAGFEKPTSGRVLLGNRVINDAPPNKREMAMVFQNYALFPHLSVYDNIAYGRRVRKDDEGAVSNSVEMALHQMNLIGMEDRMPGQLAGGEQQRVALARALVVQPKVLLFDEPLSSLDATIRVQMRDEIRLLQRRLGITSVYVTHDQAEALAMSDTVVVMRNGRIQQVGSPQDIYLRPASDFVAHFIGDANIIESRVQHVDGDTLTVDLFGRPLAVSRNNQASEITAGDEVNLVIRPEAVQVVDDRSGFVGEVSKAHFQGASVKYVVEVNDSLIFATETNPLRPRIYAEGDAVGVQFFDKCFHLLPKE